jgi:CBS-domain-containing membrane protein
MLRELLSQERVTHIYIQENLQPELFSFTVNVNLLFHSSFREVMSHPVTTLRTIENVGRIVDILKTEHCHGFPVVEEFDPEEVSQI